jgi:Calcineurin-like phosphoesterase
MVDRMAPIIIHVIANSFLAADYMCAEILGACSTPVYTKEYAADYAAAMIAGKPDLVKDNNYINDLYARIKADPSPRKTLKFAHVSDLHMDYSYPITEAEPFGPRGKETAYPTLKAIMTYIKDEIEPDFMVWTGDNSRSNTWANTLDEVIMYTVNITETIKEIGLDKVTTMYPIEGNHDTFPVNVEDFTLPGDDDAINGFQAHW